uniref:Ribonuclease HII n=1 Tax=uncultured Flavobacteriia bacterium TaxID=212695 RepID=F4MLQ4_9BACT|nr:ribonuclease HII [uncultured Flavobacteriia bacterium]
MLSLQLIDGLEAGTDEAGRGCLAGPVTAAAVILPADFNEPLLNDSKKLTEKQRFYLRPIIEKHAVAFAVAHCTPKKVDEINILNAAIKAMHKAIQKLKPTPIHILVDGNRFHPFKKIPHQCIIRGDGKYQNIAAASILAKTYRDDLMLTLDKKHPKYDWKNNKGYPTKKHREAIRANGITSHHRKTFRLLPEQL